MMVIGVDPGLTGAISLIGGRCEYLACEDIPTCGNGIETGSMKRWVNAGALDEMLMNWSSQYKFVQHSVFAFIERPVPMPSLPAQTIASQFDTFGVIRALITRRIGAHQTKFVNPKAWQKTFGLKGDKAESRAACLRLFPDAPVTLVKHHNRGESLLLARYGYRTVS